MQKEKIAEQIKLYVTCETCGMPVNSKSGSLTGWMFGEKKCRCTGGDAVSPANPEFSSTPTSEQAGGQTAPVAISDTYEIIDEIGRGGMGTVYRVRQKQLGKQFALKVLRPELAKDPLSVRRFEQEVRAVQALSHPNSVSIYDLGMTIEGNPFFVMDLVEGQSLQSLVKNEKVQYHRLLNILEQVAEALASAHAHNIVHRDLKPCNVLISQAEDGSDLVKVVDFGIAKILPTQGADTMSLTKTVEIFGSPTYMSPEQCRGERVDARSDIYSFGCLMHEVLLGRPPFAYENPVKTLLAHMYDPLPKMRKLANGEPVSPELAAILRACLEKEPTRRYSSMDDLARDLSLLRDGKPPRILKRIDVRRIKRKAFFTAAKYSPIMSIMLALWILVTAFTEAPWALTVSEYKHQTNPAVKRMLLDRVIAESNPYNLATSYEMLGDFEESLGRPNESIVADRRAIALYMSQSRPRAAFAAYKTLFRDAIDKADDAELSRLVDEYVRLYAAAVSAPPEKGARLIGWFYMPPPEVLDSVQDVFDTMKDYNPELTTHLLTGLTAAIPDNVRNLHRPAFDLLLLRLNYPSETSGSAPSPSIELSALRAYRAWQFGASPAEANAIAKGSVEQISKFENNGASRIALERILFFSLAVGDYQQAEAAATRLCTFSGSLGSADAKDDRLRAAAVSAFEGRWQKAEWDAMNARVAYGDIENGKLDLLLGNMKLAHNDTDGALAKYRSVLHSCTSADMYGTVACRMAEILGDRGQDDEAKTVIQQAMARGHEMSNVLARRVLLCAQQFHIAPDVVPRQLRDDDYIEDAQRNGVWRATCFDPDTRLRPRSDVKPKK